MRQLCKHWSHKLAVELLETSGTVRFDFGLAELRADDATLTVAVVGQDPGARDRLKTILAEHLDRFAFREAPLAFKWRDEEPERPVASQ